VTSASAINALASFAPDSAWQRLPVASSSAFAQEFEGCAALQDQGLPHGSIVQDRKPERHTTGAARQQKGNNVDHAAAVATPVTAANPLALSDLRRNAEGTQDDVSSQDDEGNASLQPAAGCRPQQPSLIPGPELAVDPQTTAFMMRMQVAAAADDTTLQQRLTDAGLPDVNKADEGNTQESPSLTQSALAAFDQSQQLETGAEIKQAAAPSQAPELRDLRADEQLRPPQPLNNLVLQVNQSANEKVLVSLVQQSGELRMAVRTDDAELAQGLQQGLSDLVGKLQGNGYRADTWHPVQASVAAGPALESQSASNHSRQGDPQSQQGWSQQDGGQQRQNQPNRPRWVEELESSLTSRGQTPGESYGFSS
jgi:hypothetical protein